MSFTIKDTQYLTKGETDQVRMILIKGQFRRLGIYRPMGRFMAEFPEYNNYAGTSKVRAVWNCDTSDTDIITKFEQLLNSIKKQTA